MPETVDAALAPGRFIRVCREHGVELAERDDGSLYCQRGQHVAPRWRVIDRERGLAVAEAEHEKGWVRDMARPIRTAETALPSGARQNKFARTIASEYFKAPKGGRRLRLAHMLMVKSGIHRVQFIEHAADGKERRGYTYSGSSETEAAEAYKEAQKRVRLRGWQEDRRSGGPGSRVKLSEIPGA